MRPLPASDHSGGPLAMLGFALFAAVPTGAFSSPMYLSPESQPSAPEVTLPAAPSPASALLQKSVQDSIFDIENTHPNMRPCYLSTPGGLCGETPDDLLHPDGLFCPEDYPRCALKFGVPVRYECSKQSMDDDKTAFGGGKCNCKFYGNNCPVNSTCLDSVQGPYCECDDGYVKSSAGECKADPTYSAVAAAETAVAFEDLPHSLKPCILHGLNESCGWALLADDVQRNVYCSSDLCCVPSDADGRVCSDNCSGISNAYSFGACTCSDKQGSCPSNMKCVDSPKGSYCKCIEGTYSLEKKACVVVVLPDTAAPSNSAQPVCGPQDCRPGFCSERNGKILCDCVEGYVARNVDDQRQQCMFAYG
ncbi:microneme protein [Cyclospora cayetanensis]|uniref:Microneme protein n=1 Tax=Cyclospora cayetanensis TaxID=88456 RepID=A0A1D3D707_9EIME|nr:microneme protein [Cyclospora cayetanensis]